MLALLVAKDDFHLTHPVENGKQQQHSAAYGHDRKVVVELPDQ